MYLFFVIFHIFCMFIILPSKAHGFNRINIRIYIYFNSLRDMKSLN